MGFGEVNAPAALIGRGPAGGEPPRRPGLAAGAHFGPSSPGPIQVVHRDKARIDGYGAAGAVLALAGLALLTWVVVRIRRFRSGKREVRVTLLSKSPI